MKVKLLREKEVNGVLAQPGWVFGVDDPTGNAWIAAGDAVRVQDEVRALQYAADAPLMFECVSPPAEPQERQAVKPPAFKI